MCVGDAARRPARSDDGRRQANAPSTSAPMSATTRAVASHAAAAALRELNRPRWNAIRRSPCGVTSALRRFASPALSGLSARSSRRRSLPAVRSANTAEPDSASMKISYPAAVRSVVPR